MGVENLKKSTSSISREKDVFVVTVRFDLKDKRDKELAESFQEIVNELGTSGNLVGKELLDEGIKAYNREISKRK
jgi:hypothetical protein